MTSFTKIRAADLPQAQAMLDRCYAEGRAAARDQANPYLPIYSTGRRPCARARAWDRGFASAA